ncbi:MAG: hypothetical protein ABDH63_05580 [Candidatus Caldarchaeales archaeon]
MLSEAVHRCRNCGAPVELSPDTVVSVCSYCGHVESSFPLGSGPLMVRPASASELRDFVERAVRKKGGRGASVRDVRFVVVPIWVAELRAKTRYNGYKVEYKTRSTGRSTTVYKVYYPVRGTLDELLAIAVYGRKFESIFGLGAVKWNALLRYGAAGGLDPGPLKGWEVLGSELTEEEAWKSAEARAADEHRTKVESMASKVFDCYTRTERSSIRLVLYPVVEARYESGGKSYRVCVDGAEDGVKVLKAEAPMSLLRRAKWMLVGAGAVLVTAALGAAFEPLLYKDYSLETKLVLLALPPGLAALWGYLSARSATSIQRVKKLSKDEDVRVLEG